MVVEACQLGIGMPYLDGFAERLWRLATYSTPVGPLLGGVDDHIAPGV